MKKKIVCIECPSGCALQVRTKNGNVVKVEGNNCPKGESYAVQEVEDPVRIVTSSVYARGLAIKMVPVKTDSPVPKKAVFGIMEEIRKIRVTGPVKVGDVIEDNILGTGADLVATRDAGVSGE